MFNDNQPEQILDAETIECLRDLGGLDEIAREFIGEVRGRIERIRHAIEHNELDTLKSEAHTLKGASGAVGAILLAKVAERLEELARTKSMAGGATLLDKLEQDFTKTCAALNAELVKPT
jgi:HPt (histidine-containing phosphotransfer) domain-containing protein